MMEMFNFNSQDKTFDAIVTSIVDSAKTRFEAQTEPSKEELRLQNEAIVKYALEGTRFEAKFEQEGLACMKNPQITKNETVRSNFEAVVAEVVNAIAPSVTSADYSRFLAEVRQVGWGDTARFIIRSNELFKVNEIAEGVNRGVLQPIFDNEVTVNPSPIEIATAIDWYAVAAGVFDWGDFGLRAGRSFEAYIFLKVIAAMTSVTGDMIGAGYIANGYTPANWTNLVQKVSAANGGAPVYAIGSLGALTKVNTTGANGLGLQYFVGEDYLSKGYIDKFLGARMIPVDPALVPTTINSTADLAVPDNKIYMVAADAYRPVKIVFEGNSMTVERIPEETTDKRYGIRIQMRVGVSAIVGSKFGRIDLN
jgi:hypothetical protein